MRSNALISKARVEGRLDSLAADLSEAERFFSWALDYEKKGLNIAADALRDEGRKSFARYLASNRAALV